VSDVPQTVPKRGAQGRGVKFWLLVALAVFALIFILLNSQDVKIKFIFFTVKAPLFSALALSTILGLIIGWGVARFRRDDRKD
jgi:uncharacterized integral membrane protein